MDNELLQKLEPVIQDIDTILADGKIGISDIPTMFHLVFKLIKIFRGQE